MNFICERYDYGKTTEVYRINAESLDEASRIARKNGLGSYGLSHESDYFNCDRTVDRQGIENFLNREIENLIKRRLWYKGMEESAEKVINDVKNYCDGEISNLTNFLYAKINYELDKFSEKIREEKEQKIIKELR